MVTCIVGIAAAAWFYYPQIKHQIYLLDSKTLPYRSEEIVGREEEIHEILELVDFSSNDVRIINIVGSPGFGKSTLAVHVGHRMVEKGVIVHYVNMAEISDRQLQQALAEKLLESANILSKDITFNRLLKWVHHTQARNLLIFDNCDDSLHYQKEALQEAVDKIVESSNRVKVVMTSREITMHLQYFHQYKLYELSTKAACALLQQKVSYKVNISVHEIESLAELAGNVPLALQIIGSLLLLPDPPTPNVIIEELKEQPISTLSPEQLPKSQQINASLSLSYKYLSRELRLGGQYIAHFPGSFQAQAAATVFESLSSNTKWQIDIHRSMQALVQRSLLVYNKRTERYNFHRLIREYFLDVQRHDKAFRNDTFALAFNNFYMNVLSSLTNMFNNNKHIKALRTLDVEKHNFQQMFENIKLSAERPTIDLVTIQSVVQATDAGLLKCRFADEEIAELLRSAIVYVKTMHRKLVTIQFRVYYSLIIQLASLEEELHGIATAIQVYLDHEITFIIMQTRVTESGLYIRFYSNLANYHFALGQYQEVIQCHTKIIKEQSEEHLANCFYTQCKFYDIGMSYYYLGNNQEALKFLQRSLQVEELGALNRIEIALLIAELNEDKNVKLRTDNNYFKNIVASLNQIPPIMLYQDCSRTLHTISLLRKLEYNEQAVELEEKLLQVIKEIGISPDKAMPWQTAYEVALHLYNVSQYGKAVEVGTFLLQSIEHSKHAHTMCHVLRPKLQMVVARSKFHAGNYSSGLDMMETVVNEVHRVFHKEEFEIACKYLLLRVRYVNKCYNLTQNIANNVLKFGLVVTYITIVPPLKIYPTHLPHADQPETTIPQPKSTYPELSHITSSSERSLDTTKNKDIVHGAEYLSAFWLFVSNIWARNNPTSYFLKVIDTILITITSSSIIRILLNIFLVWVRLFILFYMFQMFCLMLRRVSIVVCLVCFLVVAFSVISSDEVLTSFTFLFLLIFTIMLLVYRNNTCVLYWNLVIFILVLVAIFGQKGSFKECYRALRDPRMIAGFDLH